MSLTKIRKSGTFFSAQLDRKRWELVAPSQFLHKLFWKLLGLNTFAEKQIWLLLSHDSCESLYTRLWGNKSIRVFQNEAKLTQLSFDLRKLYSQLMKSFFTIKLSLASRKLAICIPNIMYCLLQTVKIVPRYICVHSKVWETDLTTSGRRNRILSTKMRYFVIFYKIVICIYSTAILFSGRCVEN